MNLGLSNWFTHIDFELLITLLAIGILIFCSAVISGSEVALFSLTKNQLNEVEKKEQAGITSQRLLSLLSKPKALLATILVTNNFINIGIVIIFATIEKKLFGSIKSNLIRAFLEIGVITFVLLLFGEVLPKIYANRNNLTFSKRVTNTLFLLNKILKPITYPMRRLVKIIEDKLTVKGTNFSVDQLSQALELTDDSETTNEEQKILEGIVTFGNTEVRQVMSPRLDIFALEIETNFEKVIKKIISKGYSRVPIYHDTIDQIEGVLFIKDLLPHIEKDHFEWQKLIRKPFFVPEHKKLDDLLSDFQSMKNHMAIVVDEYGGTCGVISLEDVLEEIVGDITDEFDDDDLIYSQIDDNTFIFDGKIGLKDFYRIIQLGESDFVTIQGEAETLAGLILEISGNFPSKNQEINYENIQFKIESVDKKRIKQVKVSIKT